MNCRCALMALSSTRLLARPSPWSKMALAPVGLTQAFEAIVEPVMARILNNLKESRSLAAQRDALLPKLVSGELAVKDAEQLIGEAKS